MSGAANDRVIEVALVNNMPDQALAATDMQFARLVRAGAGSRAIQWRRYFLPSVARSETAQRYLARGHEDIEALLRRGADALIVTGAEPRAARFENEPYWADLSRLIDWARKNTTSTIWSCLAAHAAVYHLDGVTRHRFPKKLSGVFSCCETSEQWSDLKPERTVTPHSRYNDLAEEELRRFGYLISSKAEGVGVDSFWRREPSLFVFLQGHPEYDADTLLKEYRRDVLRYFTQERDDYPSPPTSYFSAEILTRLEALRVDVLNGVTDDSERRLNETMSLAKIEPRWVEDSTRLYRAWLDFVAQERNSLREIA